MRGRTQVQGVAAVEQPIGVDATARGARRADRGLAGARRRDRQRPRPRSRPWCRRHCAAGRRGPTPHAWPAARAALPRRLSASKTSSTSWVSTHRTTSRHGPPRRRRGEQQGRQELGRGGVPEVTVGERSRRRPGHLGQRRRGAARTLPRHRRLERRPRRRDEARRRGRVVHPHLALPLSPPQGVASQVGLDRRGDHRALPLEDGRDGEPARLAALGRPHHQDRMPALGREQAPRGPCPASDDRGRRRAPSGCARHDAWPNGPARHREPGGSRRRPRPRDQRPGVGGRTCQGLAAAPGTVPGATVRPPPRRRRTSAPRPTSTQPVHARPSMRASVSTMADLVRRQAVLDQERPGADLPQRHTASEMGHELCLGRREPEQGAGPLDLARRLRVDDPRSRSPPAAPGPIRPARTRPRPSSRGPTAGAARRRSTLPGPGTTSTTTGANAPRPGWRGSPMLRPRRPRPRRRWHRSTGDGPSPACSHAVAQVMRIPNAAEWYTAERSRTTRGASSRMPGEVGPSNMPRRSPATRRRSSSATFRPSAASPATSVPTALRGVAASGCNSASTTVGKRRAGPPCSTRRPRPHRVRCARWEEGVVRGSRPTATRATRTAACATSSTSVARSPSGCMATASSGLSRIEPPGAAPRVRPPGPGQRPVLPFGVHHPGPAPERGQAPQIGLHERALAPADLPDHDHVGVGEAPAAVELEGVVRERRRPAGRAPPGPHRRDRPPRRPVDVAPRPGSDRNG